MNTNKFIIKLLEMMNEFPNIIFWSADGREIQIFDVDRFSKDVHSKYFTTSNYQSFLRQLNMYNFKKMSKRKNSISFRHEEFQRNNSNHFENIKRRKQGTQTKVKSESDRDLPSNMEEPPHSSATISTLTLDTDIRQTIALIRQQISPKGAQLIDRLEQLLGRREANPLSSQQKLAGEGLSSGNLPDYGSFCKIQQILFQKDQMNSDFHFQSNIFQHSTCLDQ